MALASLLQLTAKKRLNQVKGAYPCQDTDPPLHGCKQVIFCFTPSMTGTMWLYEPKSPQHHWDFVPLQHCSISPSSALLSKKIVINRNWSKDLIGIFYLITKCHKCWASAYQDQSCRSHFSNTTSPNHTTMWGLNISQMLSNIFLSISLFTGEVKAPSSLCVPSDSSTESWEFHIPASSHITHSSSGCRASGTAPAQNGLGNSPQASKPLQSFKQVFSGTFYITVTPTGCRILLALVIHNPSGALVWF